MTIIYYETIGSIVYAIDPKANVRLKEINLWELSQDKSILLVDINIYNSNQDD